MKREAYPQYSTLFEGLSGTRDSETIHQTLVSFQGHAYYRGFTQFLVLVKRNVTEYLTLYGTKERLVGTAFNITTTKARHWIHSWVISHLLNLFPEDPS
jgi:hypothetical protein